NELFFVIPTYRLRDVGETVEQYDEHFWRNGHSVRIIVFDDSSPSTQEKYYPLLEKTRTHNDLFYVGPREKEHFLAYLNERLRDKRLAGLVKNLFRPSYGGNRNFTLMYTLGGLLGSSDDDMRPFCLMEDSPESLAAEEVSRGRLCKAGTNGYTRKSYDILSAFLDVLGKPAGQLPDNYERGEVLVDTAMDLETNATKGLARENSLVLRRGPRGQSFPPRPNDRRCTGLRGNFPRGPAADKPGRAERRLCAGDLPPARHQEELAHGLRRGRLRQQLRPAAVLPHPPALRGL